MKIIKVTYVKYQKTKYQNRQNAIHKSKIFNSKNNIKKIKIVIKNEMPLQLRRLRRWISPTGPIQNNKSKIGGILYLLSQL